MEVTWRKKYASTLVSVVIFEWNVSSLLFSSGAHTVCYIMNVAGRIGRPRLQTNDVITGQGKR